VEDVPVAFLALGVLKGLIGVVPALFPVIGPVDKVDVDIFDSVEGLGIEKVERVLGGRQVAVHAVCGEPLGVVHMGGCLPAVVGRSDLVAGGTEPGSGGPYHGVIGQTEDGKSNDNTKGDKKSRFNKFLHGFPSVMGLSLFS